MTCLCINTTVPYLFQSLVLLLFFPQLVVMAALSLASKVQEVSTVKLGDVVNTCHRYHLYT